MHGESGGTPKARHPDYTAVIDCRPSMDLDRVDVVLVRPARAGNVAAACRAMKNMGLRRLLLVGDPPVPGAEDRALAYGAWDVLDAAERYPSLEQAVAGSTFDAGPSGRGGAETWTPRRLAGEGSARAGHGRTSLVFGPESTGLTREELRLCHVVVRIPSDAGHSSLNLAQAVLVLAYEVRLAAAPRRPSVSGSGRRRRHRGVPGGAPGGPPGHRLSEPGRPGPDTR
jgi:tRNA (cytidine32/uridine32-2'-O)-methyltransferase